MAAAYTGSVPDHAVEPRGVVLRLENLVPGHRHRRSAQNRRAQNHRRSVVLLVCLSP